MRIFFWRVQGYRNIWRFKIMGWTVYKDLRVDPMNHHPNRVKVTPEEVDAYLISTPLWGIGKDLMQVADENKVNPIYILAHIIHETGWGESKIFLEKNNLFGFGACDNNPLALAISFGSIKECLEKVVKYIAREYLNEGGKFYAGPNLIGLNRHYATDKSWCFKIMALMNKIEDFLFERRK
jgi:beta-N-acetylglucosaminidase